MGSPSATSFAEQLSSAQTAFDRADYAGAAELGAQLLRDTGVPVNERAKLTMLYLGSLYRLGRLGDVVESLNEALQGVRGPARRSTRMELLRMGSLACSEVGRYEDALRYAQEAIDLAGDEAPMRVFALNAQASCFERMGDPWQALRLMETALALTQEGADDPSDGYGRLLTLNNLGATLLGMFHILRDAGAPAEAQSVLERAYASMLEAQPLARGRRDAWPIVFIEGNLAEAQVYLGQPKEALRNVTAALALARTNGFGAHAWALRCTWAEASLALGQARQAQAELDAVMQEIGTQQPVAVLLRLHHALYRAHAAQGSVAQALHHLEQYLALSRERSSRQLQAQSRVLVTRLEMEQARQQAERARSEARRHRRRADAWADAALHDSLTGLLNRRGLEERLAALGQPGGPLTVLMVDVDHFKRVNDVYGHAVGDAVLERLGQLLRAHLRPEDVLARFGGEEFTLLLSGLDTEQALEVCERLRVSVECEDWSHLGLQEGELVTVSIGFSQAAPWTLETGPPELASLVTPADEALYRAKRNGRNRVEAASA
ncbi:MAG: tetratricopeptide repeat-containing diguanylate cyclase [Burkholderiales bacterium]